MNKSQRNSALIACFAISVFCIVLTSCKEDDNTVLPPVITNPTSYAGTFAGASESGTIHLTIAAAKVSMSKRSSTQSVVSVTGYLKTGTDSVAVTGTFNTANDSLIFAGGSYAFAGVAAGGILSGSYTGPHGPGTFTLQPSASNSVKTYVGIYTSQAGRSNGKFNLVVSASGNLTGLAVANDSSGGASLHGNVVADSITIFVPNSSSVILAHGSFSNSTHVAASGTYDDHQSDHGIWSCILSE